MKDVYDDFLSEEELLKLREILTAWNFDWHLVEKSVNIDGESDKYVDSPTLRHKFYDLRKERYQNPDNYFGDINVLIKKIIEKINKNVQLLSCYANLTMPSDVQDISKQTPPHVDFENIGIQRYTALFYLTDSDSETILYKEKCEIGQKTSNFDVTKEYFIKTVSNRLVIFDASNFHSAPIYSKTPRLVLNINFEIF
jgi:hypothetical protein